MTNYDILTGFNEAVKHSKGFYDDEISYGICSHTVYHAPLALFTSVLAAAMLAMISRGYCDLV